jgi:hypothetical protein
VNTNLLDILFRDYPIILFVFGIILLFISVHFGGKTNSDAGILFWGFFSYFVAGGSIVLGFFGIIFYLIKKIF